MTLEQIMAGEGRYATGGTVILQKDDRDEFDTAPKRSGWELRPGWHVAGHWRGRHSHIEWCDLR